jgi:O-antigen biosynthesis protein
MNSNLPGRRKTSQRQLGAAQRGIGSIFRRLRRTFLGDRAALSAHEQFLHMVELAAKAERGVSPCIIGKGSAPRLSFIVPIFNARPRHLDDLTNSFISQNRNDAELILSDDGSTSSQTQSWLAAREGGAQVKILRRPSNLGIAEATNFGIAHAVGEWIGLIDHDDALAPFALSRISAALKSRPECKLLYTDEAVTDESLCVSSLFLKPAWDPVLLSGVNYINHLSLYRRSRLLEIGGLRSNFEGSQDYDLILRYSAALTEEEIVHLPYPAYLWRRSSTTYSARNLLKATDSARRALSEHFSRDSRAFAIDPALSIDLHRPRFDESLDGCPKVSVIIPNFDAFTLISRVLNGLGNKTDYPALEIIVVDNGTTDKDVLALYQRYRQTNPWFNVAINPEPFNFSRAVNRGVALATGERILLLNNDVDILEANWLKEMVSCFAYPNVGIVGAKLLYPDRRIQHAGVIVGFGVAPGIGALAGHWFAGCPEDYPGPMGRLRVRQCFSSVTAACMMISQECLKCTGPFDETNFPIAYNDVDYCLRAAENGYRTVWTPFATLIHEESKSRGSDEAAQNIDRFRRDQRALRDRHKTNVYDDRAFNPWYSRDQSDPVPVRLMKLPTPR